jgi:hypothetical protein
LSVRFSWLVTGLLSPISNRWPWPNLAAGRRCRPHLGVALRFTRAIIGEWRIGNSPRMPVKRPLPERAIMVRRTCVENYVCWDFDFRHEFWNVDGASSVRI